MHRIMSVGIRFNKMDREKVTTDIYSLYKEVKEEIEDLDKALEIMEQGGLERLLESKRGKSIEHIDFKVAFGGEGEGKEIE